MHISYGSLVHQMYKTLPKMVQCLINCGNNIIIDEVLLDGTFVHNYATALEHYRVYFVGVECSLNELEKREKERGDRLIGIARGMIKPVHKYKQYYDLIVDTTNSSPAMCAQTIFDYINTHSEPQGFKLFNKNE